MSELAYIGPGGRRPSRPLLRTLIGEALRRNRQGQRRTLADVAQQARVSVPYLSEVERGRKEASSEVLAAVCDALRMELSDLLVEVGRELTRDSAPAPVLRLGDADLWRADLRRDALQRDAPQRDALRRAEPSDTEPIDTEPIDAEPSGADLRRAAARRLEDARRRDNLRLADSRRAGARRAAPRPGDAVLLAA